MDTIKNAEELWALPDGSILWHPKYDSLVERFHRIPTYGAILTDAIRIGGNLQSKESLHPDWDFPLIVLYRPDVAPIVPSTAQGALDEADRWLESHKVTDTWRTMNRLRDTFVRVLGTRPDPADVWDKAARAANDFILLDDGIDTTAMVLANPYVRQS